MLFIQEILVYNLKNVTNKKMDNYYIQDDFPTILVILYLLIMLLFYRITNNFWLSLGISSVIYLIAYLMYKLWISIAD